MAMFMYSYRRRHLVMGDMYLASSPDGDVHVQVRRGQDDPDAQPRVRVDLEVEECGGEAHEHGHHLEGG